MLTSHRRIEVPTWGLNPPRHASSQCPHSQTLISPQHHPYPSACEACWATICSIAMLTSLENLIAEIWRENCSNGFLIYYLGLRSGYRAYAVQVCDISQLKRSPMANSPWMEVHNDHSPLVIARVRQGLVSGRPSEQLGRERRPGAYCVPG